MFPLPRKIEYILEKLESNGFEAYIVGGTVRDFLLGNYPNDYDITTSALPQDVERIFEKTVPTGIKHGTVTVIYEGELVEVTTFRTEGGYIDHRRPKSVTFVTNLSDDLSRRDFTINAMAYNKTLGLVDLFNGKRDLDNKILRAVGDPETRFREDALRILRLFRFASFLGFSLEANTEKSAISLAKSLKNISGERISAELKKSVTGKNFKIFEKLIEAGGLEHIKIDKNPDFSLVNLLSDYPKLAYFTFVFTASSDAAKTLDLLKESNEVKNRFAALSALLALPVPDAKPQIKKILADFGTKYFKDYLLIKEKQGFNTSLCEAFLAEIIENQEPYLIEHLAINGDLLINLGFSGKEIGEKLKFLRNVVIENPKINTKKELIKVLSQT